MRNARYAKPTKPWEDDGLQHCFVFGNGAGTLVHLGMVGQVVIGELLEGSLSRLLLECLLFLSLFDRKWIFPAVHKRAQPPSFLASRLDCPSAHLSYRVAPLTSMHSVVQRETLYTGSRHAQPKPSDAVVSVVPMDLVLCFRRFNPLCEGLSQCCHHSSLAVPCQHHVSKKMTAGVYDCLT